MNVYLGELYQEVEYIQSSGTQFINTGVINHWSTLNVDIKFMLTYITPGVENGIFGGKYSPSIGQAPTLYINKESTKYLWAWSGSGTSAYILTGPTTNTLYNCNVTYTTTNKSWVVNGTIGNANLGVTNNANNGDGYLSVFADGSGPATYASMRLYSFKITVNGTLVRDFIPCYRVSDNVIGLFDKVENKFYANAGTGTFTKGNDVKVFQPELKNAYIGEVYEYSYDFRNKSTTILTNDGWTVSGSPSFNTNGMSGSGINVYRSLPNITNANKIILTYTFSINNSAASLLRIGTMSGSSLTNSSGMFITTGSSNYRRITIGNTATNYNGVSNGIYTATISLDLANSTWECTTTGLSTLSGTITNSEKSVINSNIKNILANIDNASGSGYLQTLSVTIEY